MKSLLSKIKDYKSILILLVGSLILFYSLLIFQEGNPWPQLKAIVRLNFGQADLVKLDIGDNRYISKGDRPEIIKSFMKSGGYDFVEQMGSSYLFESISGSQAFVVHRYYSHYYSLWTITEKKAIEKISLVDELKECLPKSDLASYEKCNGLLKQITDFDTCVRAGFLDSESERAQCLTPDGRVFTN